MSVRCAPGARRARHLGLPAELSFDADFAGHGADLVGEGAERVGHAVDRVGQRGDFALGFDARSFCERSPLATAVTTLTMPRTWVVRFEAMKLTLSVRSFQVPATPGTLAWPPSLPSTPTSRATVLTCSAKVLSVSVMLLMVSASAATSPWHRRRISVQVAVGDRGHDFDDAAHLGGQVAGHEVDVVGEVFPDSRNALHLGLSAELAFGADFARDAGDLGGERVQLIDHRVDGVFQLEDFAFHVDRDLLRQIAVGDGGRHLGDVADLAGQVRGHEVDVVGQIFPGAGDAVDFGLAAELSFGADLLARRGSLRLRTSCS